MRLMKQLVLSMFVATLAACGGGGGDGSEKQATAAPPPNVLAVTVKLSPWSKPNVNIPYASVTICAPGGSDCRTIDNIVVDTGSTGLRLFASAVSPALALPAQTNAGGTPLGECMQFADLTTIWGPVKLADVKLAGESASNVPVQVIADPGFAGIPAACSSAGKPISTADTFGANGVLGVSVFSHDCRGYCATANNGLYYACDASSGCTGSSVDLGRQVQNPVSRFATDNNGVLLKMPAVAATGAASATGSLVFGIGTQANNALTAATVLKTDAFGYITTTFKGYTYVNSFIDSGSNALFFPDDHSVPVCNGFYCPSATQTLTATNAGFGNAVTGTVTFSMANATRLFSDNPSFTAFSNLAGTYAGGFDWGLPFFYGRSVFTAIEGKDTPAGPGPYYAY